MTSRGRLKENICKMCMHIQTGRVDENFKVKVDEKLNYFVFDTH